MTDRQTDRQTDGRTDARGKTICLPTLSGGDITIHAAKQRADWPCNYYTADQYLCFQTGKTWLSHDLVSFAMATFRLDCQAFAVNHMLE